MRPSTGSLKVGSMAREIRNLRLGQQTLFAFVDALVKTLLTSVPVVRYQEAGDMNLVMQPAQPAAQGRDGL